MLDKANEKVGRIVPGRLDCKVGKNKDLFAMDNSMIKSLLKDLDTERNNLSNLQRDHILESFRASMKEFEDTYGTKPTVVLMSYRDVEMLISAYNKECRELTKTDGIDRIEAYSYDEERCKVDGIKIKKGCDTEYGEIKIHSFE